MYRKSQATQHLARTDLGIGIAANQPDFPAPSWPFLAEIRDEDPPESIYDRLLANMIRRI